MLFNNEIITQSPEDEKLGRKICSIENLSIEEVKADIQKMQYINPKVSDHTLVSVLANPGVTAKFLSNPLFIGVTQSRLGWIIHEVILRCDKNTIDEINNNNYIAPRYRCITIESFKEYIGARQFTAYQLQDISNCLDYVQLYAKNIIFKNCSAKELKDVLEKNAHSDICLLDIPEKLRKFVETPSGRSLEELYAAFIYHFTETEELLPTIFPFDSPAIQHTADIDLVLEKQLKKLYPGIESLEVSSSDRKKLLAIAEQRLRNLQNPFNLKIILKNHVDVIVAKLASCGKDPSFNISVINLAEMLLYMKNKKVLSSDKKEESFLDKDEQRICFLILEKLSKLSSEELDKLINRYDKLKLQVEDTKKINELIPSLNVENFILAQQVKQLTAEKEALTQQVKQLTAEKETLLQQVKQWERPHKQYKPNLFG